MYYFLSLCEPAMFRAMSLINVAPSARVLLGQKVPEDF